MALQNNEDDQGDNDDQGSGFDLRAEIFKNGILAGSGQINGASGTGLGLNNAILRSINLAFSTSNISLVAGDTLSIRVSVRISSSDDQGDQPAAQRPKRQATAELWFDDPRVNSRFDATVNGVNRTFYLRDGFLLASTLGTAPKKVSVSATQTFQPFGTWIFKQP